jgi:hypothetical protein
LRRAITRQVAEPIAEEVRRIARTEAYDEGDYHDSIEVDDNPDDSDVAARINAGVDYAHIIEWGSRYVSPQAPMRRGAEAVVGSDKLRGE